MGTANNMKITKQYLKKMIKEELEHLVEGPFDAEERDDVGAALFRHAPGIEDHDLALRKIKIYLEDALQGGGRFAGIESVIGGGPHDFTVKFERGEVEYL